VKRADIIEALVSVRVAKAQWAAAQTKFNSDVEAVMTRLLHEAVAARMSDSQVAYASGFTVKRIRMIMRAIGLNPRDGKNLLSAKAGEALANNAALLGIEPRDMDLMSPLAYLPMGSEMKRALQDKAVSQVRSVDEAEEDAEDIAHYAELAERYHDMLVRLGFCPKDGEPMPCTTCGAGL
jgi:hypothetical protein